MYILSSGRNFRLGNLEFMRSILPNNILRAYRIIRSNKGIYRISFLIIILFLFLTFRGPFSESSTLASAILSSNYRDMLLISIGIGIPSLLDLMLDFIFTPSQMRDQSQNGFVARGLGVIISIISSVVLLSLNSRNSADTNLYWSFLHFEVYGVAVSALSYLNALSGEYWSLTKISVTIILLGTCLVLNVNDSRVSTMTSVTGFLSMMFLVLTYVYYTFHLYRWYRSTLKFLTKSAWTPDLACSIFYTVIFQIELLAIFTVFMLNYDRPIQNLNTFTILGFHYGLIGVIVLMSLAHSQGVRLKESSNQDSLETKRLIIRYISHEMRNPINTVSVGLNVLPREIITVTKRPLPPDAVEVIRDMTQANETILRILDDLLTYEKLQEDEHVMDFHSVKVWNFVRHHCKEAVKKCLHRNVKVAFEVIGDSDLLNNVFVKADPEKLGQVIEKLTVNAIKVTPPGGTVYVRGKVKSVNQTEPNECRRYRGDFPERSANFGKSIRSVVEGRSMRSALSSADSFHRDINFSEGDLIRLEIIDGGPKATQNFQEMSNFDMSVLEGGQGYGLGLWICRRLVGLHSGVIGLGESENRRGASIGRIFFVELPVLLGTTELPGFATFAEPTNSKLLSPLAVMNVIRRLNIVRANLVGGARDAKISSDLASPDVTSGYPNRLGSAGNANNVSNPVKYLTRRLTGSKGSPKLQQLPRYETPSQESFRTSMGNREPVSLRDALVALSLRNAPDTDGAGSTALSDPDRETDEDARLREMRPPMIHRMLSLGRSGRGFGLEKKAPEVLPALEDISMNEDMSNDRRASRVSTVAPVIAERCCLVVDDVKTNRKMLIRLLGEQFESFDEAEDGVQAVAKVRSSFVDGHSCYDVILMDFIMPYKDGPAATSEIRELGYEGPIYAVTGNAQQRDIDHFVACGANRVFTKPLDVAEFKLVMQKNRSLSSRS